MGRRTRHPRCPALAACVVALLLGPAARAEDCAAARELQRAAADLSGRPRVEAFTRIARLCPEFNALYNLARAYQEVGEPVDALRSVDRALALGGTELRFRAFALARRAEVLAELDRLPDAVVVLEQARQAFAGQEPDWFADVRRKVDAHPGRDNLDEHAIATILGRLGRDIAVVPRLDLRVRFDFDSAALTTEGRQQVAALGRALAGLPLRGTIRLIGHTDLRGTPEYNQQLSERRAAAVLEALVSTQPGLQARLRASGAGMQQALYRDAGEESQRLNRRVEVRMSE